MKYRATLRRLKRRLPKPQPREIRVHWVCPVDPKALRAQKEDKQTHNSPTTASPHPANLAPTDSE